TGSESCAHGGDGVNVTLILAFVVSAPALKEKPAPAPSLEGEWKVERRFDHGTASTDQNLWIFSAGGIPGIRGPTRESVRSNFTYSLSVDGELRTIDFHESQGNGRSDPRQGIYRIDGDTLTFSFTIGNAARPTSFEASTADCLLVLKRVK